MTSSPASWLRHAARHASTAGIALIAAALTQPAAAHVLSMSHGTLQVEGSEVAYELRMPLVHLTLVDEPGQALLGAVQVSQDGEAIVPASGSCREDASQDLLLCQSRFEFAEPPSQISFHCDLPAVIEPQHIHVLRSGEGERARQTVLDITYKEADIRFTPPTLAEIAGTELSAGLRKPLTSPELVLFLLVLTLAGRSTREQVACAAAFLGAQASVAIIGSTLGWILPFRFLESAAALSVAYLASEALFLPEAKLRWAACGAMGCIHGLFLAALLATVEMSPGFFVPGAIGCEAVLIAVLAGLRFRFSGRRTERLLAILLLVVGLAWFAFWLVL